MARADRIPFLAPHRFVAVEASLNGSLGVTLLVDTGAEQMVVSRQAAALLGLNLSQSLRTQPLVGVGQTLPVPVVRLNHVQVGSSVATNLVASVYDLPPLFRADGLLGLNFLRRFRTTLEFDTHTLVLRPFLVRSTP
jgi:clan AA aspartic protease (TIGR02281 family)